MAEFTRDKFFDEAFLRAPIDFAKNMGIAADSTDELEKRLKKIKTAVSGASSVGKLTKETKELTEAEKELEKIAKQIATAEARNTEEYAKQQERLVGLRKELKAKSDLDAKEALLVNAKTASLNKLDQALKKNREEYAKLTSEEQRNSKAGQQLLKTIQEQDKASKELSTSLGQQQKKVGSYADAFQQIAPATTGAVTGIMNVVKAGMALIATPIGAILGIVAAAGFTAYKAISTFFTETLEGEERLQELSAGFVGLKEAIEETFVDLGKDFLEEPTKAAGDFLALITGSTDALIELQTKAARKTVIAIELARIQNELVKERIRDVVDDANTELRVNELLEKSKNKLKFTDQERLDALKQANVLLREQLEGDVELAEKQVKAAEEKIKLNGGVLQQNKLLSQYSDEELFALKTNKAGIDELAKAQIDLIKIQTDASAKRRSFLKAEAALTEEIAKAERDRVNRAIDLDTKLTKRYFEGLAKRAQDVIKNEDSTSDQIITALLERNANQIAIIELGVSQEQELLKRAAEDRIRAEGINDAQRIAQLLASDKTYQEERRAIAEKGNADIKELNKNLGKDLTAIQDDTYKDQLTALNQAFANGGISLQDFQKDRLEIQKNGDDALFNQQLAHFEKAIERLKAEGKETIDIERRIAELRELQAQKSADRRLQIEQEIEDKKRQLYEETANFIGAIADATFTKNIERIDLELQFLKEAYDRQIDLAGDNDKEKEQLAKNFALKERELQNRKKQEQRKAAVFEKALNTTRAIINTAVAVTEVAPNIPLMLLIGALGALEVSTILAQPIPAFAVGTDSAPGGLAIVGEKGPELMISPTGSLSLTPSSASIMNVPRGTEIIPADETMKMLAIAAFGANEASDRQENYDAEILKELARLRATVAQGQGKKEGIATDGHKLYRWIESNDKHKQMVRDFNLGKWEKR